MYKEMLFGVEASLILFYSSKTERILSRGCHFFVFVQNAGSLQLITCIRALANQIAEFVIQCWLISTENEKTANNGACSIWHLFFQVTKVNFRFSFFPFPHFM